MTSVVIRADASPAIGAGHVMRCLALADALRGAGASVRFACRDSAGNLSEVITRGGFTLLPLRMPAEASWQDDAAATRGALGAGPPADWLVVDHYALDARWEQDLRGRARRILAIDDLANRPHDCDVLLDQNYYEDAHTRYATRVPAHCQQAVGPEYALLRREFYEARRALAPRDGTVRRVLVALGGADASNETGKVLEALQDAAFAGLAVDVLVGGLNRHKPALLERFGASASIRFHDSSSNVAALMSAADLSIGAGGTMNWERCVLALPSLVVVIADNQRETNEALHRAGIVHNLGWHADVDAAQIAAHLRQLMAEPARLRDMGRKAAALMAVPDGARGPKILTTLLRS